MSAIITQNFRLDTTARFVDSLATDTYYMGLGRPNAWALDSTSTELPHLPGENDSTNNQVWQELFAMKKVAATDIIFASPRNNWANGTTYTGYDDKHVNIEGTRFMVVTNNFNVFLCLKADGASTIDPDTIGVQTSGVSETSDGYIWKYMYTVPTDIANKFLTIEFVPAQKLDSDPGTGSAQALQDQWAVQQGATPGAIYNIIINSFGDNNYSASPTVTVDGNGSGAEAVAVVDSNGAITDILMQDSNGAPSYGSGYDYATVTITDTSGNSATARAVLSPKGGYGADPTYDLRAHYIAFNKVFDGNENNTIPTANDFRQLSLIKNPIDNDTSVIGNNDVYNTCKSLTVTANSSDFTSDEIITALGAGDSGAQGHVVQYDHDGTTATIYYIQNEDTGFAPFAVGDTIDSVNAAVTSVNDADIVFNSGEIMFVENRDAVSRSSSQIETIRLVIEF
jgi:hypothetical protein